MARLRAYFVRPITEHNLYARQEPEKADFSGYKHHNNRKVQTIVDDRYRAVDVS
jgi:hypothetical protein